MSDCCNEFEFTNPQGTFYMDGGIRGKDGVTFYPHVSAAGVLSWTNDGGKQNPDPVNIKGADGMSAYAAAQQAGFTGTEQEFNAYLSGIGELTEDVSELKSAFNADLVSTDWAPNITKGSYFKVADGAAASSNKYARTSALWNGYGTRKAITMNDPTYEFCLALYDETGTTSGTGYLGYVGYVTGTLYIPQNAKLFGISFRRTDNATLANSDITAISAALSAFAATDTTLSVAGASADAKATGDRLSALGFNSSEYVPPFSELLGTPNYPSGWRSGGYNSTGGISTSARYIRTVSGGTQEITTPKNAVKLYAKAPSGYYISIVEYPRSSSTGTRYGVANNLNNDGTNKVEIVPKAGYKYRFYIGYSADETAMQNNLNDPQFMSQIIVKFTTEEFEIVETQTVVPDDVTSNFTVLCAKESNYTDETPTTVEWYLIADTAYQLYITKDFKTIKPIFAANYNILLYKFAVMKNGDIIAVYRSELESTGSSDAGYRKNPFVYLASENWQVQHVVDFGSNLKPSGWLLNCGFCSMPNGDAMFTEYTRPSVETVNCWKISGDITSPASWSVVKSFQQSGSATDGLEHFHYVMFDFYTGIYYISTGDSDEGSQLWYSTDNGATWTLAWQPSEKYCRSLNLIFTKDYIFWASDSSKVNTHYLFRCSRDQNGVMDFASVVELKNLYTQYVATYGLVYLPKLNALVIMDNCDTAKTSMDFRIYSIDADELYTMTTLESASGSAVQIGFRTEYTEFYPNGNYVLCGYGIRLGLGTYYNLIKGLGNAGNSSLSGYSGNVNNLKLAIYKTATGYGCEFHTAFMPD